MKTIMGSHLTNAASLSNHWGPPLWCWAALCLWLGEFETMECALCFSTVTYATLGYGDITLQERWQLLSSLVAANGAGRRRACGNLQGPAPQSPKN